MYSNKEIHESNPIAEHAANAKKHNNYFTPKQSRKRHSPSMSGEHNIDCSPFRPQILRPKGPGGGGGLHQEMSPDREPPPRGRTGTSAPGIELKTLPVLSLRECHRTCDTDINAIMPYSKRSGTDIKATLKDPQSHLTGTRKNGLPGKSMQLEFIEANPFIRARLRRYCCVDRHRMYFSSLSPSQVLLATGFRSIFRRVTPPNPWLCKTTEADVDFVLEVLRSVSRLRRMPPLKPEIRKRRGAMCIDTWRIISESRNVVRIGNPDGVGEVGNPVCGDIIKIFLKIETTSSPIPIHDFCCGLQLPQAAWHRTCQWKIP
jgi:hypothetical protein